MIQTTCKKCGKKFLTYKSRIKVGRSRYCSKRCWYDMGIVNPRSIEALIRAGKNKKRDENNYKMVPCHTCGKIIEKATWRMREYKNMYCSKGCQYKGLIGLSPSQVIRDKISAGHKGKKLSTHQKELIRRSKIGYSNPMWKGGLPLCKDCKKRLSSYNAKRCILCRGKSIRGPLNKGWKGSPGNCKKCGKELSRKLLWADKKKLTGFCHGCYIRGENNHSWKGGTTPIRITVRSMEKYNKWKYAVARRDKHTCQKCGYKGGDIVADHYPLPFGVILSAYKIKTIEEADKCRVFWDIKNGRILCGGCHGKCFTSSRSKYRWWLEKNFKVIIIKDLKNIKDYIISKD